jgi:hypothetical protein
MSLRLFFVFKLYSLNFFHVYYNFNFKIILQIVLCFLFLALNFSEGGFLSVNNIVFCESITDSVAEPGDANQVDDPITVTSTPGSPAGMIITTSIESEQTPAITTADTSSGLVIDTS